MARATRGGAFVSIQGTRTRYRLGRHGGMQCERFVERLARGRLVKINIDLGTRKRYLLLSITPRTTQDFIVMANLLQGEVAPFDEATANVLALVSA